MDERASRERKGHYDLPAASAMRWWFLRGGDGEGERRLLVKEVVVGDCVGCVAQAGFQESHHVGHFRAGLARADEPFRAR